MSFFHFADPAKKRGSNFLCSIICCLGKRSSKHKSKDKEVSANANTGDVIDASAGAKPAKAPTKALLPDKRPEEADKKCIVIDLDETLVHSSFKVRKNRLEFGLSMMAYSHCITISISAHKQRRLHCASRDWQCDPSSICAEEAICRRVPLQDGRALRVCLVHRQLSQSTYYFNLHTSRTSGSTGP